jgi:hypothetical protein
MAFLSGKNSPLFDHNNRVNSNEVLSEIQWLNHSMFILKIELLSKTGSLNMTINRVSKVNIGSIQVPGTS